MSLNIRPFRPYKCPRPHRRFDPAQVLPGFETNAEIQDRLDRRISLLRTGNKEACDLSDCLEYCSTSDPCNSAACWRCGRNFRRWFVGEGSRLIHDLGGGAGRGYAVTIAIPQLQIGMGQLQAKQITNATRWIRDKLASLQGVKQVAIGGWDFSCNEDSSHRHPPLWRPHLYLVFPLVRKPNQLKRALGAWLIADEDTPRPIKFRRLIDPVASISYAVKGIFKRRISYIDEEGRRNTRSLPLRPSQERELLLVLDQLGMTGRLLLKNIHRRGCRLICERRRDSYRDHRPKTPNTG